MAVYLVRLQFEDGTREDYHETENAQDAYAMVETLRDKHPEWNPRVIPLESN